MQTYRERNGRPSQIRTLKGKTQEDSEPYHQDFSYNRPEHPATNPFSTLTLFTCGPLKIGILESHRFLANLNGAHKYERRDHDDRRAPPEIVGPPRAGHDSQSKPEESRHGEIHHA